MHTPSARLAGYSQITDCIHIDTVPVGSCLFGAGRLVLKLKAKE
ncbi:hypothetical protein HMPREF1555_01224 [Porphyromonas gingivalis F0570]|uniref:Uncharacterized protein n=1 Tax=Porphyromonas gingivalis F0570 TaxID=1227271 RepID=A0A0E2LQV4_PORGN|nr:hypothetical protein HMPREF1555_01224 [Porphyromonas gingivalis F0570]